MSAPLISPDRPLVRDADTVSAGTARGPIEVRGFCEADRAAWHAFVEQHPKGTFFHGLGWMDAVQSAFGHQVRYLIAHRGGVFRGVLPLFEVRSLLAGRLLVSLPYATYGGVLAEDSCATQRLMGEARALAEHRAASSLELRTIEAGQTEFCIRRTHARFVRRLPDSVEELLQWIPRKARAAARRCAERYSLSVDSGPHLIPEVWRLYARSMRRLGSPNYPRSFFAALVRYHPAGDVRLDVVRHRGRAVAGLLSFLHRGTMMPYFVGIDERANLYGLSDFLYASLMRAAMDCGCHTFDFGRTRFDNPGPFEFKRHFGFVPEALEYQHYVPPGASVPDLAPTSPRWVAARSVWRRLPLAVARPLGAWLARSIPG